MNKKQKYFIFFAMLGVFVVLGSNFSLAACTRSGDACIVSGVAGTCGVDRQNVMKCYPNGSVCSSEGQTCTLSTTGAAGKCSKSSGIWMCVANGASAVPGSTSAPGSSSSEICPMGQVCFSNPLRFNNVEDFLSSILTAVQRIIVTLALVFIVIGAVLLLTSAGSPDMVERGKKAITMAMIGLAIGIAAPSILKELAGILGWGTTNNAEVNAALTLSQIALKLLNFLLGIAGILALIMLVIGGIMYLTSAGDEERVESGKKIFKFSLIGIIIVMASMVIVRQIAAFFTVG